MAHPPRPPNELFQALLSFSTVASTSATLLHPSSAQSEAGAALVQAHGFSSIFSTLSWSATSGVEQLYELALRGTAALLAEPAALAQLTDAADARDALLVALGSPDARVRLLPARLARDVALGALAAPPGLPRAALAAQPLLGALASALFDADTAVSEASAKALVALGTPQPRLAALSADVLTSICRALAASGVAHTAAELDADDDDDVTLAAPPALDETSKASVGRIRVLSVAVAICAASDAGAAAVQDAGLLAQLVDTVADSRDPLQQLNALELLGPLGRSATAFLALAHAGMLDHLLILAGVESSADVGDEDVEATPDALLGDAALLALSQLFKSVCARDARSQGASTFRTRLLPGLFLLVATSCAASTSQPTRAALAVEALATCAAADAETLDELLKTDCAPQSGNGAPALREWLELCASSAPELRLAGLGALARILRSAPGADDADRAARALALFRAVGVACCGDASEAVTVVFNAAKPRGPATSEDNAAADPTSGARWAAFEVLAALASLPGTAEGVRAIFSVPAGTALFSRDPSSGKTASEWRFAVLSAALHNKVAPSALSADILSRLRAEVSKGPFAVELMGPGVLTDFRGAS
jgi:hypothetical protein